MFALLEKIKAMFFKVGEVFYVGATDSRYNTKLTLAKVDGTEHIYQNGSNVINKISVTICEDIAKIVGTYDYDYRVYTNGGVEYFEINYHQSGNTFTNKIYLEK